MTETELWDKTFKETATRLEQSADNDIPSLNDLFYLFVDAKDYVESNVESLPE